MTIFNFIVYQKIRLFRLPRTLGCKRNAIVSKIESQLKLWAYHWINLYFKISEKNFEKKILRNEKVIPIWNHYENKMINFLIIFNKNPKFVEKSIKFKYRYLYEYLIFLNAHFFKYYLQDLNINLSTIRIVVVFLWIQNFRFEIIWKKIYENQILVRLFF